MKCPYCHNHMKFCHHENNKEVSVYDCIECPMLVTCYYLHEEVDPFRISFMMDRNGRVYMWTNDRLKGYSYIEELKIEPAIRDLTVVKLPKLVEVTPETVRQKLSFYMVFA